MSDNLKNDILAAEERISRLYNNNQIQKLSGEYNRGYTKAIQDIQEIFTYIQPDLKHHKKNLNGKLALKLLDCILKNRMEIRDNMRGFIRYNGILKDFEWFKSKR